MVRKRYTQEQICWQSAKVAHFETRDLCATSVEARQTPYRAYPVCQHCAPAARALVAGMPLSGTD